MYLASQTIRHFGKRLSSGFTVYNMSSELINAAVEAGLGKADDFKLAGDRLKNSSDGRQYFAKIGTNVAQILGEAEGLRLMAQASPGLAPTIHVAQETGGGKQALFISDYIKTGSTSSQSLSKLAIKMAEELHNPEKYSGITKFGFSRPTHCGATEQDNTWEEDWMTFWRDRRLGNLLSQIEQKRSSASKDLVELGNQVRARVVPKLLTNFEPAPKPVLLHGDLWSGNVATNSETGEPVIYDCSAYYGHNEADFGISYMFGPFNAEFYKKYHAIRPRSEPNYGERARLYELYHHLNHYFLFGGSYKSGAMGIMKELLSWADKQDSRL